MANTALKENPALIEADRVEGTTVYNTAGDKLGHVDSVMLDKRTGNVAFAVMSFGGFLGMGERYHPLPWQSLNYDEDKDGYVVGLSKEQLEKAPTTERRDDRLNNAEFGRSVYAYYGAPWAW